MKDDKEYWDRVKQAFYKSVKETSWGVPEERVSRRRGRKPQERVVVQREERPKAKFFNFN